MTEELESRDLRLQRDASLRHPWSSKQISLHCFASPAPHRHRRPASPSVRPLSPRLPFFPSVHLTADCASLLCPLLSCSPALLLLHQASDVIELSNSGVARPVIRLPDDGHPLRSLSLHVPPSVCLSACLSPFKIDRRSKWRNSIQSTHPDPVESWLSRA